MINKDNITVNFNMVFKKEDQVFGKLSGIIHSAFLLRLFLILAGVYYIFNTWYIGVILIIYGVLSGNSLYKKVILYIIDRAVEDNIYYELMIKEGVIKTINNK